ncbi:hypothetical protein FPV71_08255 [Listeria monocytogenes]|nr:hypothetical protein [Listeria monocytogenes]EAF3625982.1 hypothetical protein [Listeria monocytogenes]EAF4063611.1 hypothetical protein [Listeria monocytogenes]EAF6341757.1 hypothetical protein [Listeria monocytogenes]EAG1547780.1 hypothetical protein [Listeria monocytogenes]
MSLDFYRAESKDSIDFDNEFVGLEEELHDYLYENRDMIDCEIKCIYEIDPYSDSELDSTMIKVLMDVCGKIKTGGYLTHYEDEDEAMEFFVRLEELCKNALECNQKIFAIGD